MQMVKDDLRFNEARKHVASKLQGTASQIGVFLESESKARAPVDTGHLRSQITHDTNVQKTKATVFVGSNVEYDPHVELGTYKQQAQPHHKPAVTENVSQIQGMVKKGMKL